MPFVPVPDTAQLNLGYTTDLGDTWSTGLNFELAGGWDGAALLQLCEAAVDGWTELMLGIFGTNCNLTSVTAIDLSSASGEYAAATSGLPVAGNRSGQATALNIAMSVTLKTALRGRSYRGRVYHYGLSNEDRQNEKTWQVDDAVTVQNAYDALVDVIELATGAEHVVVSRVSGGVTRITGLTTPVTQIVGRIPIATQRRRVKPS